MFMNTKSFNAYMYNTCCILISPSFLPNFQSKMGGLTITVAQQGLLMTYVLEAHYLSSISHIAHIVVLK